MLGEDCAIGDRTRIGPGCCIANGVEIGSDCFIDNNVSIYSGTRLGNHVAVHSGSVLGSEGFGYVRDPESGHYEQFPQLGRLEIGDDSEIGANVTIDRGALDATVIGRGVKIDNLVHIAHNVEIGFTGNPDELLQTGNGVKSITQMGVELTNVGYTGPYDRNSLINTYASTTRSQVLPYSPAPTQPTGDARGGHVTSRPRPRYSAAHN